jgi:succinylarginine dihydrolase
MTRPIAYEVNFDGLVGPTHNYAGLSVGNVASMTHRGLVSNPRAAALEGLAKMKALADLGVKQAVLPPHDRPHLATLRARGFTGSDADILSAAAQREPELLVACSSASNMWVANAATVAPSADTADHRVHFTPANLVSKFHRSIEPPQTLRTLRTIFCDPARFVVHEPVAGGPAMGDEGAANHVRLAPAHGERGLQCFVFGHAVTVHGDPFPRPQRYASRQALEASQAVARSHGLDPAWTMFAQQNPAAIDAGVFHNDVISVGNENVLLFHENAFADTEAVVSHWRDRYARLNGGAELIAVEVPANRVALDDAVRSYLFNSQLVTVAPGRMKLIAPVECREIEPVRAFIDEMIGRGHTPIREVRYFDLKQSMRNGGGPACLRLRVVLTEEELAAIPPGVLLDDARYAALVDCVTRRYREQLTAADLGDPKLLEESRTALDEISRILGLGAVYPFQD